MLSPVEKIKLNKKVDFILHTPGNYNGGILEMTIVIDASMKREQCKEKVQDVIAALKSHSQVFRNVRLNVLRWEIADKLDHQVMGMALLQMGTYFTTYEEKEEEKTVDLLFDHLKRFHARSKLVMVFSNQRVRIENKQKVLEALNPFLKQKLLWLEDTNITDGREIQMKIISAADADT